MSLNSHFGTVACSCAAENGAILILNSQLGAAANERYFTHFPKIDVSTPQTSYTYRQRIK